MGRVRDATEWGNASVQHKRGTMLAIGKYQPSSEDCLTLNVLAPPAHRARTRVRSWCSSMAARTPSARPLLPLYGGGSLVRRSLKDGDGIIYVSVNYRLGALGYLDMSQFSTPERPFDSNLGLRDQVAALEWVQRNIAEFGGDPSNVTVFGESAGGNAVTTLMTVPSAKGLFAQAISESSAPGMTATKERADQWAREYVGYLGGTVENAAETLENARYYGSDARGGPSWVSPRGTALRACSRSAR